MIRKTKYGALARLPAKPKSIRTLSPTFGFFGGAHANDVPRGFTPAAQNFVETNGYITPRSCLSASFATSFATPVLGGEEIFDVEGRWGAIAASATSFAFIHPLAPAWKFLTYVNSSVVTDPLSDSSANYWEFEAAYDDSLQKVLCVASNDTNWLKSFVVESSTTTFSDFTWASSIDSVKAAKSVVAVNDRLLLFNCLSSQLTRYPTRAMWSARGQVRDFTLANGAGAEDLMSMKGEGTVGVKLGPDVILFSDQEIWRAIPTLDDFAFRFHKVHDKLGCPFPRTAKATPRGVIFLARDRELYITDGASVAPLGPLGGAGASRIQERLKRALINPTRAWALYNQMEARYELYFATSSTSQGFPTEALFYDLNDTTFWPQTFSHELSHGFEVQDPVVTSWDDISATWDATSAAWNSYGEGDSVRISVAFGSGGTIYSFQSSSTNDAGVTLDARWRSTPLSQADRTRQTQLSELWFDYEADSTSTATVFLGSFRSNPSFDAGTSMSLTTNGSPGFLPVWYTANSPIFEVRISDGGRPRFSAMQALISDAGRFKGDA